MKEETKLNKCIEEVKQIARTYQLTPAQYRYICKQVREQLNLKTMNKESRLPQFLNKAEIEILLQKASEQSSEAGMLARLLIYTGLRINEARNLQIQHIDFINYQLKVVQGKGKKDRIVPVSGVLAHTLRLFLQERKNGFVFARKNETPYTKRTLQYWIENAITTCNFNKHVKTHELRHTFACMLYSKGMSLEHLQLIMGHSSRTTTEIYAKMELGVVKEQYLKLLEGN